MQLYHGIRADSRLAPSQWETSLQCNAVPHWLGTNLESSLGMMVAHDIRLTFSEDNSSWRTWLPQLPCRRNRSHNTCYSLRDDLGVWREKVRIADCSGQQGNAWGTSGQPNLLQICLKSNFLFGGHVYLFLAECTPRASYIKGQATTTHWPARPSSNKIF